MLGSSHAGERDNVIASIDQILRAHGHSWAELDKLLATGAAEESRTNDDDNDDDRSSTGPAPMPLDRLMPMVREYLHLGEHDYLAVALWIVHTFLFDRFMISPRLALVSPVRRCGKTTALSLLAALCHKSERLDGLTAAALYRFVDLEHPTLLCDEVDTYGLQRNHRLRGVFNSGHRRDGLIARGTHDGMMKFSTFSPMAVAAIGSAWLPLTVLDRSIIIRMTRADGTRTLKRFNDLDEAIAAELEAMRKAIRRWSRTVSLNRDPEIPLRNRAADNWRPLIAIADACGDDWGRKARDAAISMSRGLQEEDLSVTLLANIRGIFSARGADRILSNDLVEALLAMDDAPWSEWRGIHDDQQPRDLSQGELARILSPFDIRPRSLWIAEHRAGMSSRKGGKGYYRRQFEAAWRAYCGPDDGAVVHRLCRA
jgi:hypothetical protein